MSTDDLGLDTPATPKTAKVKTAKVETEKVTKPAAKASSPAPAKQKPAPAKQKPAKVFTLTKQGEALEKGRFAAVLGAFKTPTKLDAAVAKLAAKGVTGPRSKTKPEAWISATIRGAVAAGFLKAV